LILSIVPALLGGTVPTEVFSYTTFITGVVDIGIVAPALAVSGAMLLRRTPLGYLLASMMLVFTVVLGVNLTAAGIEQMLTGAIGIGQFIGMTLPFVVLTLLAIWLTIRLFRSCSHATRDQTVSVQVAHV
jgi:large-conductance mechanosensitive channel